MVKIEDIHCTSNINLCTPHVWKLNVCNLPRGITNCMFFGMYGNIVNGRILQNLIIYLGLHQVAICSDETLNTQYLITFNTQSPLSRM